MIRLSQRHPVPLVLVCGLSAALLCQVILLFMPTTPPHLVFQPASPARELSSNVARQVSRDPSLYQMIAAKPLFSPTRQPAVSSQLAMPPSPANLGLVGILHAPNKIFAVVHIPGNPKLIVISIGSSVQGWIVTNIGQDRITLQDGQTKQIITFQRSAND